MARKSVEELQAQLDLARQQEELALNGFQTALDTFNTSMTGLYDGTPEQLRLVQDNFKTFVKAVKLNWRFRGLPTRTEEQLQKSRAASTRSKAKKAKTA